MSRTERLAVVTRRIDRVLLPTRYVLYAALIGFGIFELTRGAVVGWWLVGIGAFMFSLRLTGALLRRRLRRLIVQQAAEVAGFPDPDVDIVRFRIERAFKIRVLAFCVPLVLFALAATVFAFTESGEFWEVAIALAMFMLVILCVLGFAIRAGLRNIRGGRYNSARG